MSYTFTTPSATFAYNTGSLTTLMGGGVDDNLSAETNIGFSFQLGYTTFTTFKVSSNGWLSLGGTATQNLSNNDITNIANGPIIAPLWDDLEVHSSGNINYKLTGIAPARVLTVEWKYMRWNYNSSNTVMSVQVKLYEGSNVIDFIYRREATNANNPSASIGFNGGTSATDFYSINNSGASVYGTANNSINSRPSTNRVYRWTPNRMGFVSSTTTRTNTSAISKCNNLNQQIIGIEVVTSGVYSPLSLTQFLVNMNGSTIVGANTNDVTAIHIYYTGTASVFAPINEFGGASITPAPGTVTVNGSQILETGTNYFWIAYDINEVSATVGNIVDGRCGQLTVGGLARVPTTSGPAGSRAIGNCTAAPGGISQPSFWIKAGYGIPGGTANNTKLANWNDLSGNNRHATNTSANNQPTYYNNATKNMNFNPIVEFDEAAQDEDYADFMDINNNGVMSSGNNPYEVYAVIVPGANNLTTPGKFLFAGEAGANNFNAFDVRSGYAANDSWNMNDLIVPNMWAVDSLCMLTFDYNYSRRETFRSGASVGTLTTGIRTAANNNNALAYQRTADLEFYDGGIAEIITYANANHNTTTREKVETYLGIRHGVTLMHNYRASNGTIVWNRATNAAYNNNIIGIARDDNGSLLQKQSKSTSSRQDILTVSIGPTLTMNQATNTGSFTAGDRSYFMTAHNNAQALNSWPGTAEKPASICCRILREWLVQMTNFTNTDVKLIFDFNAITTGYLPLNAGDLRLLVDADGDFTNATILNTPTITINAAAGIATITVAASVFNSTPYFTLASISSNTALPLQLKAFSGLCNDEAVQVKWTTGTTATADFSIERSNDKVSFSAAGTVKPNASGNYVWTDQSPLPGTVYYRLKTTNDNGMVLYSPVITVNSCNTTGIQLSTNPVTNESTLMLQLSHNSLTEISLYDLTGRRSDVGGLTGKRGMEKGVHYIPVHIPGTVAGMYLLHVVVNGERHVYKIIKK